MNQKLLLKLKELKKEVQVITVKNKEEVKSPEVNYIWIEEIADFDDKDYKKIKSFLLI